MSETRKIAAILVADVVGYSRLAGADEDRTLSRLRGLRSDLIDPAIATHRGRIARLGEGESGTARLEEAVAADRAALEEYTRERVPLQWAATEMNLGNALTTLGERESGTARLEEAVAAYRAALEERTRERVPLDWAMTEMNLATALLRLGSHRSAAPRARRRMRAARRPCS